MPRIPPIVKWPLAVPYFVLILIDVQILDSNVLHGIANVAPNDTGRDQWMKDVDVS
jgi:hypothetical protein